MNKTQFFKVLEYMLSTTHFQPHRKLRDNKVLPLYSSQFEYQNSVS